MMNRFCAAPEMDEVHAELLIRVSKALCVCGAAKLTALEPFCNVCIDRLQRVDYLFPSAIFFGLHTNDNKRMALWLFDLCCDMLRDPNLTVRTKRQED